MKYWLVHDGILIMDCYYPHFNWLEAFRLYTAKNKDFCHSHGYLETLENHGLVGKEFDIISIVVTSPKKYWVKFKIYPRKTDSKRTWKWMVGIQSFPFGARPIFRCELLVSGSVSMFKISKLLGGVGWALPFVLVFRICRIQNLNRFNLQ